MNYIESSRCLARHHEGKLGFAFVAESPDELQDLIALAEKHLRERPNEPIADRIYYSPNPLRGDVAFVYPGSGNHFAGMGRDLGAAFPHVLHRQMAENKLLQSQYHSKEVWFGETLDHLSPRELIFAQVALGTLVSDLMVSFGATPRAAIPYSLGESAGLFGTRAWRDRDEMFRRMEASTIFESDLAGPCNAVRATWRIPSQFPVEWKTGVVSASPERIRAAIAPGDRVYLQIINTADDCVIGGDAHAVDDLVAKLGATFVEVRGVSTAHCEVANAVRDAYRELHLLPTDPPQGIRFYSGAWGRAYDLNRESAADAITAAALDTIDFPRVVRSAHEDGVRIFIEVGPGASCTRMIGSILLDKPHLAKATCVPRQDNVVGILRLLAHLHAEGVPIGLSILYGGTEPVDAKPTGPTITLPVGYRPVKVRSFVESRGDQARSTALQSRARAGWHGSGEPCYAPISEPKTAQIRVGGARSVSESDVVAPSLTLRAPVVGPDFVVPSLTLQAPATSPVAIMADAQVATIQAHDAFLRFSTQLQQHYASAVSQQTIAIQRVIANGNGWHPPRDPNAVPRSLDFAQCTEFARGLVGNVLGSRFAEVDLFPTRVRLPDGPLQLVDRIVTIEGEPLSMTSGRLVTEHRVHEDRWYLEHGRIPACIAIEAGQADLFLSGYLGIDFKTRGLACYRLLDAAVTFHRELPKIGELITYDIRIDHFFRQGDTYLFRFRFEGSVNGEPLLTMRDGCAGFFTAEELAAGKGVVHTALDLKPMPGKKPDNWSPPVPLRDESLSDERVDALRRGDLVAAFGPEFSRAMLKSPMPLPGGMLKLVDRALRIEATGGRYGLGRIRCEADIHPDDWFLTCHFVDDQVMPGTLMYECCLHTLRVLLMRMGWVCEDGEARFEPVAGVASKLKCRGQVIATTKKVVYEISLKEIGFRPEPYVICDALMYADGKPIVDITNMSLRLVGMSRERLDAIWSAASGVALFTRDQVLEFATGNPSKAFGDRYFPFDRDRFIARLPGAPYSFIDRVTHIANCEPWKLAPGGSAVVEYDVPPDAWYFASNRCDYMPYCVLNEIALQACGWMAAYLGSALTSPDDLLFRNLGGNATQHRDVRPNVVTLTTNIKLTKVSPAAGMIILQFDFDTRNRDGSVYSGDTTFGFFTRTALATQVGLKDARLIQPPPSDSEGWTGPVSTDPPFPDAMLRMVDWIAWTEDGGRSRSDRIETIAERSSTMGIIEGRARVNPDAWFFKAHFYQDPVWPGSLGLESLVQLLKVFAHRRWGVARSRVGLVQDTEPALTRSVSEGGWQALVPGVPHRWTYRGQILPTATEVTIQAYITELDDSRRFLKADGLLAVDGRIIYQMNDFSVQG